jgi:DNA primase
MVMSYQKLTLSESDLARCRPVRRGGSSKVRAFCPFHGSDKQRSLSLDLVSGRFQCFACGAWGYTEEASERWRKEHAPQTIQAGIKQSRPPVVITDRGASGRGVSSSTLKSSSPGNKPASNNAFDSQSVITSSEVTFFTPPPETKAASRSSGASLPSSMSDSGVNSPEPKQNHYDLQRLSQAYQAALPNSWGAEYLRRRGISLELALRYGVGYASPGTWAHKARDWKWGRLVFPHTDPDDQLINFYGRAVGSDEKVPKTQRHDHLPGSKAYYNAAALHEGTGPLFITEGVFDALSLIAAGYTRTIAIFGVNGWRWEWLGRDVTSLVFALDADQTGQNSWRTLAREACLRGKKVGFFPPEAYGGHKDINEAWLAGVLQLEEQPDTTQL